MRGLVRNIKNEIFFANQNLELIRKLLVWVATYTVMTIVLFMMSTDFIQCIKPYSMSFPGFQNR